MKDDKFDMREVTNSTYRLYKSFVDSGFTEEQALTIIIWMLQAGMKS